MRKMESRVNRLLEFRQAILEGFDTDNINEYRLEQEREKRAQNRAARAAQKEKAYKLANPDA